MADLSAEIAAKVRAYLDGHPLDGARPADFRTTPAGTRPRSLEFLLRDAFADAWYVRWPNGTLRWEREASLRARGIAIPRQPLIQDVTE